MLPLDEQWIYPGTINSVEYQYMNPGTYKLQVRMETLIGTNPLKEIEIVILPPWWQTWWFRSIIIIFIIVLILLFVKWREILNERNSYHLKQQVFDKTKDLREAQAKLVESEKMASVGLLTSGIAHEINNPLNFIHGSSIALGQFLNENIQDKREEFMPLMEALELGVERVKSIVTSVNRFSRKGNEKMEFCDIHSIIDNCLIIIQNETKDRIIIEKSYTTQAIDFYGKEGELHQLFLNVLMNSVQAIPSKGQITISTNISKNQDFIIVVTDTGVGIESENLDKITTPFFTTKSPGKGTGLGMAIGYRIVEEHGGNIKYQSIKGEGTAVYIKLSNSGSSNANLPL